MTIIVPIMEVIKWKIGQVYFDTHMHTKQALKGESFILC